MDFTLFGNGLITLHRLMGGNIFLLEVITVVFPSWHHVNKLLNSLKTSHLPLIDS